MKEIQNGPGGDRTLEPSPFDYDAKLAELREKLMSYELESDEALTVLSEISKKCSEEEIELPEAVGKILNLLNDHGSVEASIRSGRKKLSIERELKEKRKKAEKLSERKNELKTEAKSQNLELGEALNLGFLKSGGASHNP